MNTTPKTPRKVRIVRAIVKAYFVGALAGSFVHIVTAAHKLGLSGIEAWVTPAMIDGIAIIGMVMRSREFVDHTNRIGFKVQCGAGVVSLAMNVYAAHNLGGAAFGAAIVGLFILAEWLSDNIKSRVAADAEAAVKTAEETVQAAAAVMAACSHPTTCTTEAQCDRKTAAAAKARKTIARQTRQRNAQARALDSLVNA